ncbi:MAG TPA: histidine phosphatase family protein [Kofleriaceae bacterium]|nr:histidine phosphatase family protein [Kofleriaceae bacterium]
MSTRLILIRHADSWHKVRGVVGGQKGCRGLTDEGRDEAARLRDRLARLDELAGAALYSSTLARAVETAAIVSPALGATAPRQHCGLCSYHVSDAVDGMPVEELRRRHSQPGGGVYRPYEEGVEAWAQLLARVGAALFEIAIANAGRTALLVAHSETIEASLVALGEMPIRRPFDLRIAPTSMSEWLTDDDLVQTGPPTWSFPRWTLVRLNDAAHLEPPPR